MRSATARSSRCAISSIRAASGRPDVAERLEARRASRADACPPAVLRYALISNPYTQPMNFTLRSARAVEGERRAAPVALRPAARDRRRPGEAERGVRAGLDARRSASSTRRSTTTSTRRTRSPRSSALVASSTSSSSRRADAAAALRAARGLRRGARRARSPRCARA